MEIVVLIILETLYACSLVMSVLDYMQGKPLEALVYLALFVVAAQARALQERKGK